MVCGGGAPGIEIFDIPVLKKCLRYEQCWASYSETVISYFLLITPYKSNTFTHYFVSEVITFVTRYFTILLLQPNQPPKKVTVQLPKLHPLHRNNNFVLLATNVKTGLSIATPSVAYYSFNISDSLNQSKPLVEGYISVNACIPHRHEIPEDKKHLPFW